MVRLWLLDHPVHALSLGRVEDPTVAQPERDVRRRVVPVRDQIAPLELALLDRSPGGGLLLVGIARHEPPEPAIAHVDQTGAVDSSLRHAAPQIRRPEVAACLLDDVAVQAGYGILAHPAGLVVHGPDPDPAVTALLHLDRLTLQELCHALGIVLGLGPDSCDGNRTENVHAD